MLKQKEQLKKYNNGYQLFNKDWFTKNQKVLLFLLNSKITKRIFRYILRIDYKDKIYQIMPNYISYNIKSKNDKFVITTAFNSHRKYSKRLYYGFYWVWYCLHSFDMGINLIAPKLNLGFDTLTVRSDPDPETDTVDGHIGNNVSTGATWATLRDAGTGSVVQSTLTSIYVGVSSHSTTNNFMDIYRGVLLFDTSDLTTKATITKATLTVVGAVADGSNTFSDTSYVGVYSSSPASNTNLVIADYDQIGTTIFSNSMTNTSFKKDQGKVFTFITAGINAISKTGITKLSIRNLWDADNSAPTWAASKWAWVYIYSADEAGTTRDPVLVITYSVLQKNALFFNLI